MISQIWSDVLEITDYCEYTEDILEEIEDGTMDADQALVISLNDCGRVDIPLMKRISGLSEAVLCDKLKGAIFQDPEEYDKHHDPEADWLLREQYLSGNMKHKLRVASQMDYKYHRFDSNIAALRECMPESQSIDSIGISLGASWIKPSIYALFIKEVLKLRYLPEVSYSAELGRWNVKEHIHEPQNFTNEYTYGTSNANAIDLIRASLNAALIKVYREQNSIAAKSGKVRVLDRQQTLIAQEKQALLEKRFQTWVKESPVRMKELESTYYDLYASNVAGKYDGSFLSLPELNPEVTLYPHQRNAVARMILSKDIMLNHAVGSGKTYEIIVGIHERKRMGLSNKNLIVVPNSVIDAFENAHRYLYPQDSILVIYPSAFTPAKRKAVLEQIRDEDFTAIYIAFSSFERITMSAQYKLNQKLEEIRETRAAAAASAQPWEQGALKRKEAQLSKEWTKMQSDYVPDPLPCFDELNINTIVVDEAHHFKNITLETKTDNVAGLHANGSKRCNEMMEKVQFVRRNGGSAVFSTGTPLTNSICDLFTMQKYLQPEQLELLKLGYFDEWISNFAERKSSWEIDVDSQNFRITTRFASFHNLPELTSLFSNVCDFYYGEDSGMGLPKFDGYIDTEIKKTPELNEFIDLLVLRTEMIRSRLVGADEDNLLSVTSDGRSAALDVRLVEPNAKPNRKETKVYACAKNVYQRYCENPGTAQLVFCDLGTPKKGFNIYDELKDILIEMGIPAKEIEFIHNADTETKRRKLFESVNAAKVRVLMGSTAKLGTGVNVQERLIAIHHLDIPWKPSDMVQREGRLIRQGNTNPKVYVYRYITIGTFDAYSWQIVENKQRFIGQFMKNTLADRDARDLDDCVLSYGEIKALAVGDPLLKTRVETANELEREKINQRQRQKELGSLTAMKKQIPEKTKAIRERNRKMEADSKEFARYHVEMTRKERQNFGELLLSALERHIDQPRARVFKTLFGFEIMLPQWMSAARPYVQIKSKVTQTLYEVEMKDAKALGCVARIENVLKRFPDQIAEGKKEISRLKKQGVEADVELSKGNAFDETVTKLSRRLMDIDEELNRRAMQDAA